MTQDEWRIELSRRVAKIESDMDSIQGDMVKLQTASAAETVHRQNVERRLTNIESSVTWILRIIVGGFLGAILAYSIAGGFAL